MVGCIIEIIFGFVFIYIGISNFKGNISLLHSYHTKNVSDEDKPKLGKLTGIAMLVIAFSLITSAIFFALDIWKNDKIFSAIAEIVLEVGLLAGCIICVLAIKKYNKSIF